MTELPVDVVRQTATQASLFALLRSRPCPWLRSSSVSPTSPCMRHGRS